MPIEIKELHIKAIIAAPKEGNAGSHSISAAELQKWKKEILAECIEKVFRKLEERHER